MRAPSASRPTPSLSVSPPHLGSLRNVNKSCIVCRFGVFSAIMSSHSVELLFATVRTEWEVCSSPSQSGPELFCVAARSVPAHGWGFWRQGVPLDASGCSGCGGVACDRPPRALSARPQCRHALQWRHALSLQTAISLRPTFSVPSGISSSPKLPAQDCALIFVVFSRLQDACAPRPGNFCHMHPRWFSWPQREASKSCISPVPAAV